VGPKARRRRAMSHVFVWVASLRILLVWTREGGTRDRLALISFRRALARGAAVCGAEVFGDFIGLAFQRGIGVTRPAGGVAGCLF